MKRVKVEIPFHLIATNTDLVPGDEIEVSEEQLARIQAVDKRLVAVLGDVKEAKPKKQKKQ